MVTALCRALVDAAKPRSGSLLLEVGTGSGRTFRPLAEALMPWGARLIGLDLSVAKLCQLAPYCHDRVQGDAAQMPFPDDSFDAIVTVHVMHLVAQREKALQEFHRLLLPAGVYLRGVTQRPANDSVWSRMRQEWQSLLESNGLQQGHGERDSRAVGDALMRLGATCKRAQVSERTVTTSPGRELDKIAARAYEGTWNVPPELLPSLLAEFETVSIAEHGSMGRPLQYRESVVLEVWRFPGPSHG